MGKLTLKQAIVAAVMPKAKSLSMVPAGLGNGGWYPIIRESYAGAWQRNDVAVDRTAASAFHADFACKTLIARDIAKLGIRLMKRGPGDIWSEVVDDDRFAVLQRPNHCQTVPQFWESWILSKLSRGNSFILIERNARSQVESLYVLDPTRVTPLIAEDGSVFYDLATNEIAGLPAQVRVPATEIIHDRFNALFHPPVGVPPIYASGLAAMQGLNIQSQSVRLFNNNAQPGGILTAPDAIGEETAERIKAQWDEKFGGRNYGKVAVLGDGLKFERFSLTAVESQLIEQLKWSAETVCSTYHVPPYKIGVGQRPSYASASQLDEEYFASCIQSLLEDAEACLDRGLAIGKRVGLMVEFDVENLIRMNAGAQMDVLDKGRNYYTPNEGRKRLNLPPVEGGDSVYRQQQDFSLEALAKRDAQDDPFATGAAAPALPKGIGEGTISELEWSRHQIRMMGEHIDRLEKKRNS